MVESGERLTERHLQAVWYDRRLRPAGLCTRSGVELNVIDPGRWNSGPGPDFLDAVLELGSERRIVRGDVEVHLRPGDWEAHGHGSDAAYRRVVLHVTWSCGPDPVTLPADAVTVWLGRFLSGSPGFSPAAIDLGAYPYAHSPSGRRPCESRFAGEPDSARECLAAAGRRRLAAKSRRMGALLADAGGSSESRRQAFYLEVMEALGYVRNRTGFRQIASAVPLSTLLSEPENAERAFLAAAGFVDWPRGPARPCNSPESRLRAAAALFTRTDAMSLADTRDFSRKGCRSAVRMLRGESYLGAGRAAAVFVNIVVPFALAEGRLAEVPEWLPCEDLSEPIRLMAFRLFGRDHNPCAIYAGNGLLAQGLLQIYRELCESAYPACGRCDLSGREEGDNDGGKEKISPF